MKKIMTGSGYSGCHAMLTVNGTLNYNSEVNQRMDHVQAGQWTRDTLPFRIANIKSYDDKTTTVFGYSTTENLQLPNGVKIIDESDDVRFSIPNGYRVCMFEDGSRNDYTQTTQGVRYDPYEACKVAHDIWAHNNYNTHKSREAIHEHVNGMADLANENYSWENRRTCYCYHKWARDPSFRDNVFNMRFKNNNDQYCDPDGNVLSDQEDRSFRWMSKGRICRTSMEAPVVYFNVPDMQKPMKSSDFDMQGFYEDTYRNSITVDHGGVPVKMGIECVISGTGLTDALTGAKDMTTYQGTNGWISIITKGLGSDKTSTSQGVMKFYNFSAMRQLATDVYYLCDDNYWTIDESCDYANGKAVVNSTVMSQGFLYGATGEDRIAIFRKQQPGETADKIHHGGTPTDTYDAFHYFTREPEEIGGGIADPGNDPNWMWYDTTGIYRTLSAMQANPTLYGGTQASDFYSGFYCVDNYNDDVPIAVSYADWDQDAGRYRWRDLPENTGIIAMNYHFTTVDE